MDHIPSFDVLVLVVALRFIFSYQEWAVVDLSEFEDFFPRCGLQVLYCFLLLFSQELLNYAFVHVLFLLGCEISVN